MPPVSSPPSIDFFSLFTRLSELFFSVGGFSIYPVLDALRPFTNLINLLLSIGVVYTFIRLHQLRMDDRAAFHAKAVEAEQKDTQPKQYKNEKWARVEAHIHSENQSDWRLAILECDIILEEMVEVMGYRGETLGEKLKQAEKSDFNSIDAAWEAHKIRNVIAHDGADYALTHHEAKRIVGLYKEVFEEFNFV